MVALDELPPEILSNILAFTSPFEWISRVRKRPIPAKTATGPTIDTLAATNRFLHDVVENYARFLLKKHANLGEQSWRLQNYRQSAFVEDERDTKRSRVESYRRKWWKWLSTHCLTCKKKSVRRSIFEPTTIMCMACDKNIPKMTMTEAVANHLLSPLDLFTPNFLHPTLPPLTVGTYVCYSVNTTMISTPDVMARKDLIHSMITSAGEEVTTELCKRRCSSLARLMADLDVMHQSGKIRKRPPHWPNWESTDRGKRSARAIERLHGMWKETGVDSKQGNGALLSMDSDLMQKGE